MTVHISRRSLLGATLSISLLTACRKSPAAAKNNSEVERIIDTKNNVVAFLDSHPTTNSHIITQHQQAHINSLHQFIDTTEPSKSPIVITDLHQALDSLISQCMSLANTSEDNELRRTLYLISASDAVHQEMIGQS